jgi:hypothetical protein
MAPVINADRLLALLGMPVDEPEVGAVAREMGIPDHLALPEFGTTAAASAPAHGLALRWGLAKEWTYTDGPTAPDAIVIVCVFFYAPGHEQHAGYAGELPHGLRFDQDREQVRELLGPRSGGSTAHPIDRWSLDRYELTVDFSRDGSSATLVSAFLPWPSKDTAASSDAGRSPDAAPT